MNRTRHDDESLALAEQSVGAAVRRGPARAIARWVFILGGFVGLVCVMLAVAAGINGSARSSTEVLATPGTPISHSFSLHGAPDAVAKQLQAQLTTAIEAQRITVAKAPTDAAEYTVRGYVVSAREKGRTKVSYIWDVTDPAGKRVNRITGEEVLSRQ